MKVRAKFQVQSITHLHSSGTVAIITLAPVFGDANEEWSKSTPQGKIEMTITNPGAIDAFEIGGIYFVDFSKVE